MQKLGHEINFVTFLGLVIMDLQFPLLVYAFFWEFTLGLREYLAFGTFYPLTLTPILDPLL